MKLFAMSAAIACVLISAAFAYDGPATMRTMRVAQSNNACLANCSYQNESCKRVCPATYNVPCLSACDSQAQTCRQGCQTK